LSFERYGAKRRGARAGVAGRARRAGDPAP